MCRHLAYLGPPRTLSQVLLEPSHGLFQQAWAPQDMRGGGTINVDGFGVGWYPPHPPGSDSADPVDAATGRDEAGDRAVRAGSVGGPVRVRSAQPIWSDTSFAAVARVTEATGMLGAVRAASPGMPVVSTANAPFTEGRWLFSHNGFVLGWPDDMAALASTLPVLDLVTLDAPTDASLVWALVRHRLRAGDEPGTVLAETVRAVDAASPGSRLNLLLTDGATIWATAWRHALAVHADPDDGSVTVASEPTDALPAWTQVPDRHLVVARPGHHEMHPLVASEDPAAASGSATAGSRMTTESGPSTTGTALVRLDVHLTEADADTALRADVARGLTSRPKELAPKWFYDARGSELFEEITDLPEYYPFRTERALLADSVADIARTSGAETVVELGSGSSTKTRLLLDAFREAGTLRSYVPQDVSESALRGALDELSGRYPDLALHGVVGDFTRDLAKLPGAVTPGGRRMIAFLGGTIGNLLPGPRHEFLTHVRSVLAPGEQLLLGTGLVTDPDVMVPAYDDAAGVTAEFNRNVLHVLNRELGADFDVDAFTHVAFWDPDQEWIEMRLRADRDMAVRVAELDLDVTFTAGELICTEVSAKFRHETLDAMVEPAGFEPTRRWTDPDERFALSLVTAV